MGETARHEKPGRCSGSPAGCWPSAVPEPDRLARRADARDEDAARSRTPRRRSCWARRSCPTGAELMLADRITAAAELYKAGRVDKLLLSGDHCRVDYDEVGTMRRILLAQGIPARGHLHRPRRLRHLGQRAAREARLRRPTAVVVTQRFHMARALYDARRAGLQVTGFAADRRDYGARHAPAAGARGRRARQDDGRRRDRRRPALPRHPRSRSPAMDECRGGID